MPRNGRKTLGILGLGGDTSGYASEAFEVFFSFSFLFSLASLFSFSSRFRLGRSVLEMGVRVHEGVYTRDENSFSRVKGTTPLSWEFLFLLTFNFPAKTSNVDLRKRNRYLFLKNIYYTRDDYSSSRCN